MHFLKIVGYLAAAIVVVIIVCVVGFLRQIGKDGWEQ
jgi:hypothetical protein